jgi:hypothetical protein
MDILQRNGGERQLEDRNGERQLEDPSTKQCVQLEDPSFPGGVDCVTGKTHPLPQPLWLAVGANLAKVSFPRVSDVLQPPLDSSGSGSGGSRSSSSQGSGGRQGGQGTTACKLYPPQAPSSAGIAHGLLFVHRLLQNHLSAQARVLRKWVKLAKVRRRPARMQVSAITGAAYLPDDVAAAELRAGLSERCKPFRKPRELLELDEISTGMFKRVNPAADFALLTALSAVTACDTRLPWTAAPAYDSARR